MTAALAIRGARRSLRGTPVLRDLTLSVAPGECRALIGMNGAGKTTALRAVLGMLRLEAGSVRVLGHEARSADRRFWAQVGHLVETPFCYPELTARENIRSAAALHGAPAREAAARGEHLAAVLGLEDRLEVPARRLSLGGRQKVGLIAALAHRPRLVLLDEPTNALDPFAVLALRGLLAELTADGVAVLVTSHHLDEVARCASRADVLHGGRVVGSLPMEGTDLERAFFEVVLAAERAAPGGPS
ncbi:ABC transporter ATP-binding protein [Brachybacterium sp. YJGR34]|uniref:ABC transporter ATP-binding protein n=1 Tax=Brachybacterium sp. YJGR34 TaxID=2059911 RepID=UPI000E0A580B|nr:ABC transporter ATP-binding protein [Brachybacterium sp. YJGR34]